MVPIMVAALALQAGSAAAVTVTDEMRQAIAAYEEGDYEEARTRCTALLEAVPEEGHEAKALVAFFLLRSLEALDRTMDIAERISLVDVDALPEAFRGDAIALVMQANLIRLKSEAALGGSEHLPPSLTSAEHARIQALRGRALRGRLDDHAALIAFADAAFLGGYDAEQSVRTALDDLGQVLREAGRLAEAETIARIQQALAIPDGKEERSPDIRSGPGG